MKNNFENPPHKHIVPHLPPSPIQQRSRLENLTMMAVVDQQCVGGDLVLTVSGGLKEGMMVDYGDCRLAC